MASSDSFIKRAARKVVSLFERATTASGRKNAGQTQGKYRPKTVLRKRTLNDDRSITTTTQTETRVAITDRSTDVPAPLRIIKDPFASMPKPDYEMFQLLREQATSQKVQPNPGKLGEMHEALGSHGVGLGIGSRNTINFDDELFLPISPSVNFKGEYVASDEFVQLGSINSCAATGDLCLATPATDATSFDDDKICSASIASNQAVVDLLFAATPSYHLKSDGSIAAESIASTRGVRNFQMLTPPRLRCKMFESSPVETVSHIDIFSPTWCEADSWAVNDWTWVEGGQEEVESRAMAYKIKAKGSMKPDQSQDFNQAFGWMGGICV